jgi:hypothetical protein
VTGSKILACLIFVLVGTIFCLVCVKKLMKTAPAIIVVPKERKGIMGNMPISTEVTSPQK